ncbi:lipoate--protein ligase family protein [filamentous cyanobacterium LEGE 11480]|uniref:Lipoate--protein ligase family protein n=1 Tax=Romeriopsis navalis LEGE 11480 TaxID=2777977 RepID=A0A928VQI7_9CYAN|nr:biotin/lipoate A/B protein ligase family protein [Romeriopsis navalis]MBE9031902.1 lipoate--protein ligase family protein [Romeriopsis navalis LEGE 11480]
MPQPWRLIPLMHGSGELNMAIDRWLLDRHVQGSHPPTLRFYTWEPLAISLGYHQKQYPAHWPQLTWQGQSIDLVKRPTGGRAVLHQGDLTYAVIASGLSAKRRESYEQICQFLIQGWKTLGVELLYGGAGRGYIHNPNCFGTATAADLVMPDGAKFIGSAQLHRDGAILQHGSMQLAQDANLFEQVFGEVSLMPKLPKHLAQDHAVMIDALTQAAVECFDAEFSIEPLTEQEIQTISSLYITNT